MTVQELAASLFIDENVVVNAVHANGFKVDDVFDGQQKYLIGLYVDYLNAMEDMKNVKDAFKYTDGEETVDKSNVYDQHRRYALDLYDVWKRAKDAFDKEFNSASSFYVLRKRADEYERPRR